MTVESNIGTRPDVVDEDIDAPDLWSSILTFSSATQLQGLRFRKNLQELSHQSGYVQTALDSIGNLIDKHIQNHWKTASTRFVKSLELTHTRDKFMQDIRKTGTMLNHKINKNSGNTIASPSKSIASSLKKSSERVHKLLTSQSGLVVKFGKFGFLSLHQTTQWVSKELRTGTNEPNFRVYY